MAMINGSWETTKILCGNHPHGAELPEMELQAGARIKYTCPECRNSVELKDYEKILDYLAEKVLEADEAGEKPNLTHHKWRRKNLRFEVISHKNDHFCVAALDITQI